MYVIHFNKNVYPGEKLVLLIAHLKPILPILRARNQAMPAQKLGTPNNS